MIRVKNKKAVANLSTKSLLASRTRNLIAVAAIAITTLLFTALFTIALSINKGFQESNFRQVGGFSHGGFKYLTQEQFEEIKNDPLIKEWGVRRFLGMPEEVPFNKSHVELGYSDANQAHWMYCDPVEGRLPKEGTDEAATDTRVLQLLGIKPELGTKFTVSFVVDGHPTTQTFTLCGWWEYDEAVVANHILLPESRVNAVLEELGVTVPGNDGMTGTWNLDVMFSNAFHIEKNLEQILVNHGYQSESPSDGDNYIATGVNWGYSGAQLSDDIDFTTVSAIVVLLLLIIFTGYLIIYNVFQISVVNDIRFYGLLKTIGTTPRQLRRIIRRQAMLLSLVGIPVGLLLGWLVGGKLTPIVISQLNGISNVVSANPLIFVISALFTLFTVWISCFKPARMAAKVSPIEAVRYTEGGKVGGKKRRKSKSVSVFSMAWANLGRSKGKTVVTVLSLSLAVVLLTITVTFTNGFDMDKYLRDVVCDFQIADAGYFQTKNFSFTKDWAVPQTVVDEILAQDGVTKGGKVYGCDSDVQEFVTEEYYRAVNSQWTSAENLDADIEWVEKNDAGLLATEVQLYGMESFVLDRLTVLEGNLEKVYEPGSKYIAAVYTEDDYGNPEMESNWAKVGDTVTLRYVEKYEYYNPKTGEVYPENADLENLIYRCRAKEYRDVNYTVAALVSIPSSLSYRYYGDDSFILNNQTLVNDAETDNILYYAFDTDKKYNAEMEAFLKDYTEKINPQMDYESKETYVEEFENFRNMFLLMGSVLSSIVALVGILNFFNAILTGISVRQREFAMLQSIGMTGKQLKQMLIVEGLFYTLGSAFLAFTLVVILGPVVGKAMESIFWFFTYRFTILPVVVMIPVFAMIGIVLPLASYRGIAKQTVVERLRTE